MTIEQDFLNAARTGDQETFLNILNDQSININPNHADEDGYTALIWAAENGHGDIVSALLADERVDPNCNDQGATALNTAAYEGHSDILRELLADERIDPNCNDEGNSALIMTTLIGRIYIVCSLLADTRINPNHADGNGVTALILAASEGHTDIARVLLADQRVDPNHAAEDGATALVDAAREGRADIVDILLNNTRIDLSHADQAKKAIVEAAKNKHGEVLGLLLKFSGQRLSDDEIANLTGSDRNFYKRILTRTRLLCRARFRGIVRAIMVFRRMRLRAAEAIYAPGGTGYAVAADSFATAASQQSSSRGTLTSTETNDTTAGITQTADEQGEPLTKKQRT
jgi:ankyrin repeat protein